jgi:hypothetical protein
MSSVLKRKTSARAKDAFSKLREEVKQSSANIVGLKPIDFVNLFKQEGIKIPMATQLREKLKELSPKDKQDLYNSIEHFGKTKEIKFEPRGGLYDEVATELEDKFKNMIALPENPKGPLSSAHGGKRQGAGRPKKKPDDSASASAGQQISDIQQPVGLPIAQTVPVPIDEKLVKSDNADAKKANVQGVSNEPINKRLDMGSSNNPSDNAVPNQSENTQSNSVKFTQYMGTEPVINPQLIGQTKQQQNDRLNINSASAGLPPPAIGRGVAETAEVKEQSQPEFQRHVQQNQPVRVGNVLVKGYKDKDEIDAETEAEFQIPVSSEFAWSDSDKGGFGMFGSGSSSEGKRGTPRLATETETEESEVSSGFSNRLVKGAFRRIPQVGGAGARPRAPVVGARPLQAGGRGVMAPPQPEGMVARKAYSPEQVAILRAQVEDRKLAELEEANADREQNKTIGARENTGLSTRFSRAGADIVVKPQEDIKKSIDTYANFTWIPEGARNDSKLTKNSKLQKLWNQYDEERYTDTYNPQIEMQYDNCHMFDMHRDSIKEYTDNRYYAQSDFVQPMDAMSIAQNIQFSRRPAMTRYPTLYDLGDYTYQHNNIVGTTNLGMVPERELLGNRRDYYGDTLHYCDTIIERDTGVIKYI